MTRENTLTSGFTLIELLVVVLIIGILAAVALPQYNKAIMKSRAAQVWPMLKAIEEAGQAYYLENDAYPTTFADLSLDFKDKSGNAVTGSNFAATDLISYHLRDDDRRTNKQDTCSSDGKAPIAYATFTPAKPDPSAPPAPNFTTFSLLMCNGKRYCQVQGPASITFPYTCKDIGFNTSAPNLKCFSAYDNCYVE